MLFHQHWCIARLSSYNTHMNIMCYFTVYNVDFMCIILYNVSSFLPSMRTSY